MEEDWDNLIVLDVCRADLFFETIDTSEFDEVGYVTSLGSSTPEWTRKSFADEEFGDTVYISSNPWTSHLAKRSFHNLIEVWDKYFDREGGTVLPEEVSAAATRVSRMYPNKCLIVHYMQPHCPFLTADWSVESRHPTEVIEQQITDRPLDTVWDLLRKGKLNSSEVWEEYANNLEIGFSEVRDLVAELDGRTVITSDHGNLVGEWVWPAPIRGYGHPEGLRLSSLTTVPWVVLDGEQRDVVAEGVNDSSMGKGIEEKLQALGYVE